MYTRELKYGFEKGGQKDRLKSRGAPAFYINHGKIAFVSGSGDFTDIFTMNPDGSAQARLTNNALGNTAPTWAPDKTKIAFQTKRNIQAQIYVMKTDGSAQIKLS